MSDAASDALLREMMALHPKVIDLTLDRMWRLLDRLGNPQDALPPIVHVAGTNGKGSTVAMLRAGLEASGRRCHVYTSPHLVRFHERIRLAGELISEPALAEILAECRATNGSEAITYFEITTCAAFLAMARVPAEFTLLEVGLGGRLDATNVIARPRLTAITPVSMDHEAFLGDTLAQIAFEKAGILKPGVPGIIARQPDAALEVIERRAADVGAPLLAHAQHWHVWEERGRLVYQDDRGLLDLPLPALAGAHQIENAGTALALLREVGIGETGVEAAMTRAHWPARLMRLSGGALARRAPGAEFWLDGGHNPAAGTALAAHLRDLPPRPTHLVCGMLATKEAGGFLAPLAPHLQGAIAVPVPDQANGLAPEALAAAARGCDIAATPADSVTDAVSAITRTEPAARIVIAGSLYLAGAVLREGG